MWREFEDSASKTVVCRLATDRHTHTYTQLDRHTHTHTDGQNLSKKKKTPLPQPSSHTYSLTKLRVHELQGDTIELVGNLSFQ